MAVQTDVLQIDVRVVVTLLHLPAEDMRTAACLAQAADLHSTAVEEPVLDLLAKRHGLPGLRRLLLREEKTAEEVEPRHGRTRGGVHERQRKCGWCSLPILPLFQTPECFADTASGIIKNCMDAM